MEIYISVRAWERESKKEMNIPVRACVGERAIRGDEYICACVRAWERERTNEEMNISVRACVGERAKTREEYICACVRGEKESKNRR